MMKNKILLSMTLVLLFLRVASPAVPALPDSVTTDSLKYTQGQTVTVTGEGTPNTNGTIDVTFDEELVLSDSIATNETGTFLYSFDLEGNATLGDYTVTVVLGETTTSTVLSVISDEEALTDNLLLMVEESKIKAEEMLSNYTSDEDKMQDLNETMSKANSAYDEAKTLIDEGNYGDVNTKLNDALSWYGKVISDIQDDEEQADSSTFNATLTSIELQDEISRLLDRADSLEQRAQSLSDDGLNVEDALNLIDQAREKLLQAQSLIDTDNTEAKQVIKDAVQMLNYANTIIKDANKTNTVALAQKFMEKAQERAQKLELQITHLMQETNASPTAINAVQTAFQKIYTHMNLIKGSLSPENLNITLDEIHGNSKEINDTYKHIGNGEDQKILRNIEKLDAEIEATNATLIKLSQQGINTTALSNQLKEAKQNLEDAKASLGVNNGTANTLINQAENTINEIKNNLNTNNYMTMNHVGQNDKGASNDHAKGNQSKKGDGGETTANPYG